MLIFGLQVTAIGIGIVFFGLVVLIGLVKLISLATGSLGKKKEAPKPAPQPVSAPATVRVIEEEAPAVQDDSELIAVITAAVAAAMGTSTASIQVRSYKKLDGGAWNKAGRREVLENRL